MEEYILISYQYTLRDIEYEVLLAHLERFDGDKRRAARSLQVSLKTIYNRMREMINDPKYSGRMRSFYPTRRRSEL